MLRSFALYRNILVLVIFSIISYHSVAAEESSLFKSIAGVIYASEGNNNKPLSGIHIYLYRGHLEPGSRGTVDGKVVAETRSDGMWGCYLINIYDRKDKPQYTVVACSTASNSECLFSFQHIEFNQTSECKGEDYQAKQLDLCLVPKTLSSSNQKALANHSIALAFILRDPSISFQQKAQTIKIARSIIPSMVVPTAVAAHGNMLVEGKIVLFKGKNGQESASLKTSSDELLLLPNKKLAELLKVEQLTEKTFFLEGSKASAKKGRDSAFMLHAFEENK
jgi:hypothetical protein